MKLYHTIILLFLLAAPMLSQETEYPHILESDSTWNKEIFPFPIQFAPQIDLKGYEDAQFPPGWAKQESQEFWSYVFAWNIKRSEPFTVTELERDIELYFDGLMTAVNKDKEFTVPPSAAEFIKEDATTYVGKVTLHDSFHTRKMLTLNIRVSALYCEQENKSILAFRFSPKPYEHEVWKVLSTAKLVDDPCLICIIEN